MREEMIVGTAIGVAVGDSPRWYVITASRVRDIDGRVAYAFTAHRDDGYRYHVFVFKERLDAEDVTRAMDGLVEKIRKDCNFAFFEILCGSGVLSLMYVRGLWA
jgi:hypothetical protein